MKIARKLALLTAMPVLLLVIIGVVAISSQGTLTRAHHASELATVLETQVFALSILSYDYERHREPRAQAQWKDLHAAFGETLSRVETSAETLSVVERLRATHRDLASVFGQLTAQYAQPAQPFAEERESWLLSRLLLDIQGAFADAAKFREAADVRVDKEERFFAGVTITLLSTAALLMAAIAWRTASGIRKSLRRLHRAAEAIAGGDFDYRAVPTPDEHGELALALNVMARNIKVLQQRIVQSEKLSAVGVLAAGVAHELNNPLMGVMGYVGRARMETQEAQTRQELEQAEKELARMRDLLKNMLGFAHPVEEKLTRVNVAEILNRALALIRPDLRAKNITLITEIAEALPTVVAKENALQQVFLNLMLNARDAVEGRPKREIRIDAHSDGQSVVIRFADSGPGIPQAIQSKLFDPFVTTKPPGKGIGLGLPVSWNIVADLGGTLTWESREGMGAAFTVTLPLPRSRVS